MATTSSEYETDEFLPQKPEEPLPTDCCGSGCTPCVNDLYQEEMSEWLKLKSMTVCERRQWWQEKEKQQNISTDVSLSQETFRFELISIQHVTQDSFLYSFALPQNQTLGIRAGQHAILRIEDTLGHYITRQYTPISPLEQTEHFDVVVKIYDDGRMTQLIKSWKIGTLVDWKGPFGDFSYSPNQFKQLVMLACGTGIAPMVQIIRYILDHEDDYTFICLLYASRTQHDILLKDILDKFKDYWNFKVTYFLSRSCVISVESNKGLVCYDDVVQFGRIDKTVLINEIPSPSTSVQVLVCGTKSFDKDMIKYLLQIGYTRSQIFKF